MGKTRGGRAGFKFRTLGKGRAGVGAKPAAAKPSAEFEELVTQARPSRSSGSRRTRASGRTATRSTASRKRQSAGSGSPAVSAARATKRQRRTEPSASTGVVASHTRSGKQRRASGATPSGIAPYPSVPAASVRLPHARYAGEAALHKLVDAAIDAELAATAQVYRGGGAYLQEALEQAGEAFKKAVASALIRSVQQLKNVRARSANPGNTQLQRRERDLRNALERFKHEQQRWKDATVAYSSARQSAARGGPDKPANGHGDTSIVANLPEIAKAAITDFEIGVTQMDAAVRISEATLKRGAGATSGLSARFYSESFRNVPNHEQPAATVRSFGGRSAATSSFTTKARSSGSVSTPSRERRSSNAAGSGRRGTGSAASSRSRRKSSS